LKLPARQLDQHLRSTLAHTYLVSGDEPLLVAEAARAIVKAAREREFTERTINVADRSCKWSELEAAADNLSLFARRRIVELRLPTGRPGEQGGRVIASLCEQRDPDRLLLVVTGKLEAAVARSTWVKSIETRGVHVQVWPVERGELPRWLNARAASLELDLGRDAAELLADRVEGNLLAAAQELEKLALARGPGRVTETLVAEAVANSARFDVFRLTDAAIVGNARRALTVMRGLKAEGVEPVLISWALGRELILLARLKFAVASGASLVEALARQGVWRRRVPTVTKALERLEWRDLTALLGLAVEADGAVKGGRDMRPWEALTELVLALLDPQGGRFASTLGA
jgi:DNA polymerase III subunit delta